MKFKPILKIKSLHIKNFKSIVDLTIKEPNPFTVFVGPNGSGKSNIFEALEFLILSHSFDNKNFEQLNHIFGNCKNSNKNHLTTESLLEFKRFKSQIFDHKMHFYDFFRVSTSKDNLLIDDFTNEDDYKQFLKRYSRLFFTFGKDKILNISNDRVSTSGNNLEKVLKRLLENKEKREEISEWLELFLPEFDRIEVQKSEFSSNENLLIYQKHYKRPFNKELISDGTYNIIALLTAVYQSDEPQFLCIEEPENGLNPKVVKELVNFFRDACEDKGHYIWLNTHSQTLVSQLKEEEMIVVDKINGETQIKQFKKGDFYGMPADEALLTNALGGGLPW
ncbi:hypothetical protein GCM10027035_41660 [Emticicia sediminis]